VDLNRVRWIDWMILGRCPMMRKRSIFHMIELENIDLVPIFSLHP